MASTERPARETTSWTSARPRTSSRVAAGRERGRSSSSPGPSGWGDTRRTTRPRRAPCSRRNSFVIGVFGIPSGRTRPIFWRTPRLSTAGSGRAHRPGARPTRESCRRPRPGWFRRSRRPSRRRSRAAGPACRSRSTRCWASTRRPPTPGGPRPRVRLAPRAPGAYHRQEVSLMRTKTAEQVQIKRDSSLQELGGIGLSRDDLIGIYRTMVLSRRIDDKEIQLKRQNRIFFQISGAGHEAVLTAAGRLLRPGHDWFYPYYRDRALCLQLGVTPREMFLAAVGSSEDPASGGRQMPSHWGSPRLRIVSQSSPTGTQFLQAVGCAEAGRMLDPASDAVVYVSGGDGATSEGEIWEALNAACLRRAPVVFLITDNEYAISVPVEAQTAGGSVSRLAASFKGLRVEEVDGCDPLASYAVLKELIAHARSPQGGPVLLHAHTTRPYSHSLSDDQSHYRPRSERESEALRDPIPTFAAFLSRSGAASEAFLEAVRQEVDR